MPKQQKQKQSRKNYLNPYFGPSGSRGGIQIRLPNTLPTFSRNSINIPTGSRPGSTPTPSKPSSSEPSGWSQFDKYGGRALLIGTGAHLAYKGGKYIQQRFISSQGRNFAPGQEPRVPNRVADDVPDIEVIPDEQIEMANLGANRLIAPQPEEVAPEGIQPFEVDSSNVDSSNVIEEEGEELQPLLNRSGQASEGFFDSIAGWFRSILPEVEAGAEDGAFAL